MASLLRSICKVSLIWILFSSIQIYTVTSTQFEVGDDEGWLVPNSKNSSNEMYNLWASKHRFIVDDSVRFKYKEDSVMVVGKDEYEKCKSDHPFFYSNNGDTVFKLDRPGLFYFISGIAPHCRKGEKMIIKVLEPESPPQFQNQKNSTHTNSHKSSGAPILEKDVIAYSPTIMFLVMSFLWLF